LSFLFFVLFVLNAVDSLKLSFEKCLIDILGDKEDFFYLILYGGHFNTNLMRDLYYLVNYHLFLLGGDLVFLVVVFLGDDLLLGGEVFLLFGGLFLVGDFLLGDALFTQELTLHSELFDVLYLSSFSYSGSRNNNVDKTYFLDSEVKRITKQF